MSIIWTILIGLVVGLIARAIKPGNDAMGWIMTIVLGVVGSLAATYGGQAIGLYQPGQSAGFIASVIGAIVVLFIYGLVSGKK
ncbi:GlsB/YeaQ/YmgE family stress response membrane protein [Comamonas serinivorans]|uniref:GlsB/YeaQ/YmgE family stress response membrane protein n=1 Tax=Comamonas serinivorans TaxID=1082851 RepID=A0A1Y0ELZ6_9BURK|nr:GlsB/YeaQ/YmgE family stress response membrane protein [Comamonas serinivorans]ARU04312.1 GlsB/YeaQ/YmgE family stress response membrane protein [Comamonas serinivorans]